MANISLKDIQFPGLNNVYKVPEVDSTLTQSGAAADAKKTGDELSDLKQDFNSITDYTVSPNLLDVSVLTSGYLRDNGTITQYGDWLTTDFIPVETGKIYTPSCTNNNTRATFPIYFRGEYDENKQMITGTYADSGVYSYTITSENAKYVRFSYHNTAETERCFMEGTGTKYYPYGEKYYKVDEEAFPDDVKADLSVVDAVRTRNLFDKNAVVDGYISNSSGAITVSGDWVSTDYIPVEYGELYSLSTDDLNKAGMYFVLELNENKGTVSYESTSTLPYTPSSATVKYVRFSVHSGVVPSLVFDKCTQGRSIYTPFGYFMNAPYNSTLYGKKWVAVGDSLTEKNVSAISNYTDFISVLNNMEIINKGVGGTGYMRGYDTSNAFYQRVADLPDCDIITIFGSGNDLAYYSDLGDVTDTGTSTICGCINETLDVIFENHPTTPLLVIAPTPWAGNTPDMATGMTVYCEKLQAICSRRGIAYLDLFHHSGLRPDDDDQNSLVFYDGSLDGHSDFVHPNKLGHSIIAPRIMQAMESVMIF